jgi:tetratricopeptide (TPR) repeat protein
VTALAGRRFGVVGALAAFPLRLAAREVERQGGTLRRGTGRRTSDVVLGRRLLAKPAAVIEARVAAERAAGRRLTGEAGLLRLLGLAPAPPDGGISRQAVLEQSGLAGGDLDRLALFDAFEHGGEPYSFRDVILARKYAGLIAGGAGWADIARSVHRSGPVASLTAKALELEAGHGICVRAAEGLSELDGQMLLDLGPREAEDPEALFEAAEAAEAAGRHETAAQLYAWCLEADPRDAVAAFNRANCLRAAGSAAAAAESYTRALKLDPAFVEAWFNLAGLMREQGHVATARRHLARAVALDPGYADAVFNLASLEFEAGTLDAARRWWERYLELDSDSEWARRAARGIRYVQARDAG